MFKKIWQRIRCVSFKADPDFIEIWSGVVTVLVGIFLLLPMHTFTSLSIYHVLDKFMPEEWWGLICLIIGALKIICYLLGTFSQRRICLFIMTFLWMIFTGLFIVAWDKYPHSLAPILFGSITLAIMWAFIRVGIMRTVRENIREKINGGSQSSG